MEPDITLTGIVVGTLLPNVIAIVVQPHWRGEVRGLVAFAVCVVAGLVVATLQGDLGDGRDLATSVVAVLITSQVLYQTLWRPSGIAPGIESGTSLRPEQTRLAR